MSSSSEQTRQRILASARHEFLHRGFPGANLRAIANRANVTTGALYAHFAGKEDLFTALVGGPATEFVEHFRKAHREVEQGTAANSQSQAAAETDWALDHIYAHRDTFVLIVTKSEGTQYAHYIDVLIEIEETTYRHLLGPEAVATVGSFFIHVMASSGIREMFDALTHGLTRHEALLYMDRIKQFHFAGWNAILQDTHPTTKEKQR